MAGGLFQFSLFEVLANHRGARIICAEFVGISFSQSIHQLLMKIVMPCSYWRRDAFVVHLARPIDVFPQPIVKVTAAAAVLHFLFVVEFDFRNQKPGEASRVIVQAPLFFAYFDRQFRLHNAVSPRRAKWSRETRRKHGRML